MKKIYLLLLLTASLANAQVNVFDDQLTQISEGEMKAHSGKVLPLQPLSAADYHARFIRCEWTADPAVRYIAGKICTYFVPLNVGFNSIRFDLSDSLTVDSVNYHSLPLTFTHIGGLLNIPLPGVVPPNVVDSIDVYYQGIPPATGFGSFALDTHALGAPVMWTLSQPYGASDWWPCKDALGDKADSIDVIITTPTVYRGVSNGLLASTTVAGPDKIYHWKHRYPIATYLICFAISNYAEFTVNVPYSTSNVPILNDVYQEDSALAAASMGNVVLAMQVYDTLFGLYPFDAERYGHVQCNFGGGMEHQTTTFIGNYGYELLAHELAHHWFGDKVTCGSWQDIWLNEGFATYLSGLTYEHLFGGIYWKPFKQIRINDVTSQPDGSVWCDDTTLVSRIFDNRLTYAKGAMILNQLRWVIGDSAFFAAINNYLTDPAFAYRFARTSDLQAHFEASSGQNLTWYFNDWFYAQGFPSYQLSWQQNGNSVSVTVNQTQSHVSVPFFALPIPIEFKDQTNDTIIRFNHTFSGQTFTVNLPFTVDSVKFDPELWIISANDLSSSIDENELSQQVSVVPNPAHDHIQISFVKEFEELTIELADVTGRVLKTISASHLRQLQLDVTDLAKGVYFIRLNSGKMSAVKKIVID
jgi:hypothetical protein